MQTEKPFALLLFCTIMVCVLVVLFRFVLQDDYPVLISYDYPSLQKTAEEKTPDKADNGQAEPEDSGAVLEMEQEKETDFSQGEQAALAEDNEHLDQSSTTVSFPLELNQATFQQLIPRVGDVTASRILAYREELGGFTDVSQLLDIQGIGPVSYETIRAYVYISGDDWDQAQ